MPIVTKNPAHRIKVLRAHLATAKCLSSVEARACTLSVIKTLQKLIDAENDYAADSEPGFMFGIAPAVVEVL